MLQERKLDPAGEARCTLRPTGEIVLAFGQAGRIYPVSTSSATLKHNGLGLLVGVQQIGKVKTIINIRGGIKFIVLTHNMTNNKLNHIIIVVQNFLPTHKSYDFIL